MLKKAAFLILLFLVGAGIGVFGGWHFASWRERELEGQAFGSREGRSFLRTYGLMARMKQLGMGSVLRFEDPKYGPNGAREYLNLILETAQKERGEISDPEVLTLIDVENGITYLRLAQVEEALGNTAASQVWMEKAQGTLEQAGWKDRSESHLKEITRWMNEQESCSEPCGKTQGTK
jgi:hypothetical protein